MDKFYFIISEVLKQLKGNKNFPKSLIDKTINKVIEDFDLKHKEMVLDEKSKKLLYPTICQALLDRKDLNVR